MPFFIYITNFRKVSFDKISGMISLKCFFFRFFFFCSPRDSTGVLGVKMVESVLGGSPTNKESPLSNIESRLHGLKFDEKVSDLFVFVLKYQHVTHTIFNSISNSRTMR